jgi:hypothetical protein
MPPPVSLDGTVDGAPKIVDRAEADALALPTTHLAGTTGSPATRNTTQPLRHVSIYGNTPSRSVPTVVTSDLYGDEILVRHSRLPYRLDPPMQTSWTPSETVHRQKTFASRLLRRDGMNEMTIARGSA